MSLSTLPFAEVGATGILAIAVLMIFRGALIPRKVHEDRMKDKDQQIDYYRSALEKETTRSGELTSQVGVLMEVASTAEHVFRSLPVAAAKVEGSTTGDLVS